MVTCCGSQFFFNFSPWNFTKECYFYGHSPIIPFVKLPNCLAQLVTCLATDASLNADPGVASWIWARSNTFVEIDHEINSMVILLTSAESFKKGCCQLQAKVCAGSTG